MSRIRYKSKGEEYDNDLNGQRNTLQSQTSDEKLRLPENWKVGQAIVGGDSFFDSVAKGLKQLKPYAEISVKSLRKVCKELAESNQLVQSKIINGARYPKDNLNGNSNDSEILNVYLANIQYTSDDINKILVDDPNLHRSLINLNYGNALQPPIRGRPDIEGCMICKQFNVKLHIIEKSEGGTEWVHHVIDETGCKSTDCADYKDDSIVHIINKGNAQFQPILRGKEIHFRRLDSDEIRVKNFELFDAIRKGKLDTVRSLLEERVSVSIIDRNNKNNSPLHYAVEREKKDIVEELLRPRWKANIDQKNNQGNTPLHLAVLRCNMELVQLLLNNHANVGIMNNEHQVPLDISKMHDSHVNKKIAYILEEKQAQQSNQMNTLIEKEEVIDRLKEFVTSFVYLYERTLSEYYDRLENQKVKTGKWADFTNTVVQTVKGASEVTDATNIKASSFVGNFVIQSLISGIGIKHNRNQLKKLMNQLYTLRKDPCKIRETLVVSGIEIFQSFESQFVHVTADGSWERAMEKLAHDAVNRVIDYSRKNTQDVFSSAFITTAVVRGESKVFKHTSTGLPHSKSGHKLDGKGSKSWNTAEIFDKSGLQKTDGCGDKYYKKRNVKNDKYGYRRLFKWESEDEIELARMLNKEYQQEMGPREEYTYISKPDETEHFKNVLLAEINNKDPKFMEKRIFENFQEGLDQAKENAEEFFSEIEKYLETNFSDITSYLENNKNEIKEIFNEVVRHHQEASLQSKAMTHSIEDGREENRKGFEQINQKLDELILVKDNKLARPIWFDVRESVKSFTGRQKQLEHINSSMMKGITVISGLGGVGKSELAIKYARNYFTQQESVIWINAETHETAKDSFRRLLKRLGLKTTDQDGDEKSLGLMAKEVYEYFAGVMSLFIFDNAVKHSTIKEFLPSSESGYYVLITSQNRELFTELEYEKVELDLLPEEMAIEFVRSVLSINNGQQEREIRELVETLGRLPLALQHAVAYIKESGYTGNIGKYVEIYKKSKQEIQTFLTRDGLSTYDKTIFLTFKATIDKVNEQEKGNVAGEVLNTIAYLAPDNIPKETLLKLVQDKVEEKDVTTRIVRANGMLTRAISFLSRYSITNFSEELISIHRLVQQVIRLELEMQNDAGRSLEESILAKILTVLQEFMSDRDSAENYMPHIISVWNYASKYDKLVEAFISSIDDSREAYTTHFHSVAASSSFDVVEAIVNKIDPNRLKEVINAKDKDKRSPLHNAALNGDERIVRLLIEKGADVNAEKKHRWTSLHLAAESGHLGVVNVLLENGANVDAKTGYKFTPLHLAARDGRSEVVLALLERKADINSQTKFKFTPLHLAAENNHLEVVELLLKNGVCVDAETEFKFTSLHLAARKGHLEIVRALLDKGANVDSFDNGYFTPLHLAVQSGHSEIVKILLNKGSNINTKTTKGNTPLHLAAEYNHFKVVQTLVSRNANINIENDDGKTPFNLATGEEIKDYIRQQTFNRRPGTAGIRGQLYEINLLMLFLLQGSRKTGSFYLATNVKEAGDFDDVVFKYETSEGKSKIIFLQAKHRENPEKDKITIGQLFSESEKGDYNLKKYFNSFRKIKQLFLEEENDKIFGSNFEDVEFVIYTNASSAFDENEDIVERVNLAPDSIFSISEKSRKYYKLVTSGEDIEKKISVIQYSSDCKRLARDLALSISSNRGIVMKEGILGDYHIPLAREVIERNERSTEGNFRESFLNSDSQFRNALFDELKKCSEFAQKSEEELKLHLQKRSIKLSDNFGKKYSRKGKYPEYLPSDLVSNTDIKEFCRKLKLFTDQYSEDDLGTAIKHKLQELYNIAHQDIDTVFSDIQNKVLEWWKKGSNYLTERNRIFQDAARISIKFDVKEPVALFTGRLSELENLNKMLQDGGEAVVSQMASVTGLGGVGKSELARKYISEYGRHYDDNVIWINAYSFLTIAESFRKLAQDKLGITTVEENGKQKEIKLVVEDVYGFFAKRHRRSLFVFDNAGKYKAVKKEESIYEFLPHFSNSSSDSTKPSVLITSRYIEWGEIKSLALGVFTEHEANDFIRKALQIESGSQENEINDLIEALHCLPLALQQAVSYINKENQGKWRNEKLTVKNYLELFHHKADELLGSVSNEAFDRYTNTVLTTWQITIEKIKQKKVRGGKQALDILGIIAYLAPDKIPIDEIFLNLIDDEEIRHSAVELLDQYSMAHLENGMLRIHRLVQQVTRIEIERLKKHEDVVKVTFNLLKGSFYRIRDELKDFSKRKELLPHFEMFLSHIDNWLKKDPSKKQEIEKTYLEDLLVHICDEYHGLGNPWRQKELMERALPLLEEYYGSEHIKYTMVLTNLSGTYGELGDPWKERELAERAFSIIFSNPERYENLEINPIVLNLGNAYEDLGDHQKKKELLEWALRIEEERYGPDHINVARLLASVSSTYGNLGDFHKAKEFLERAVAIKERYYGPRHFNVAVVLSMLGNTYGALGDHLKKKELLERSVAINEEHYGRENFHLANYLESLGFAYRDLGDFFTAKELLERALMINEKHYGPDHFKISTNILNLGIVYLDLEDVLKAKELFQRALLMEEKHFGPEYFRVGVTLINLGSAYGALREYKKQKDLLERALDILGKHYGPDHYEVSKALLNLGVVYGSLGEPEKKKEILERTLPILERHYGREHFEVAILLTNLGIAYGELNDFHNAKDLLLRSLQIKEKHFGPEHIKLALTLVNLGTIFGALGDYNKAKEFVKRALTIKEKHYGEAHIEVALLQSKLGRIYGQLGEHQEQKELLERALPIFEKEYGPEHLDVTEILAHLSSGYRELGCFQKAKDVGERTLEIKEKNFGPEHYEVAVSLLNLGNSYGDLGDNTKKRELLERALPIFVKKFGTDHFVVAKTLNDIGVACLTLGDYEKAKELMESALETEEKYYGPDYFEISKTLGNLSIVYGALGFHQKQKDLLERALKIDQKHYGLDHIKLTTTLLNLGNTYGELEDFHKAKDILGQALSIEEKHYGVEHIKLAVTLINLSTTYGWLGDHEMKKILLERTLRIFENQYGIEHIALVSVLGKLGKTHGELGDFKKSMEVLERVLAIKENHYGYYNMELGLSLLDLCNIYDCVGDHKKKILSLQRILDILEKNYGPEHIALASTLGDLGKAYGESGNFLMAKECFERAVAVKESHYGADDFELVIPLSNLATSHGAAGDHKQRKDILKRALSISEKCNHPIAPELREELADLDSLHYACRCGNLDLVISLIAEGADVIATNGHDTVLHRAVSGGNTDVVTLILSQIRVIDPRKFNEHVNAKDTEGDTPLMWAAEKGKPDIANILLESGADLNVKNNFGETALHWSAKGGHQTCVEFLLNKQADPHIRSKNGRTPLDLTKEKLAEDPENDTLKMISALLLSKEASSKKPGFSIRRIFTKQ